MAIDNQYSIEQYLTDLVRSSDIQVLIHYMQTVKRDNPALWIEYSMFLSKLGFNDLPISSNNRLRGHE